MTPHETIHIHPVLYYIAHLNILVEDQILISKTKFFVKYNKLSIWVVLRVAEWVGTKELGKLENIKQTSNLRKDVD